MRSDLKFKQGLLEESETTAARLRVQKEQIQGDLEKVKNLEGRIYKEMEQAKEKIQSMEDDLENKFPKTDDLKQRADQEREKLKEIK